MQLCGFRNHNTSLIVCNFILTSSDILDDPDGATEQDGDDDLASVPERRATPVPEPTVDAGSPRRTTGLLHGVSVTADSPESSEAELSDGE